jgi:hypothetical protein
METSKYRLRDSAIRVGEGVVVLGIVWAIGRLFGPDSAGRSGIDNVLADLWAGLTFHVPVPVWVIAAIVIALLPAARRSVRAGVWWPFLSDHEKDILRLLAWADGQSLLVDATANHVHARKIEVRRCVTLLSKRGLVDMSLMSMDMFSLTPKGEAYVLAKGYLRPVP